MIAVTGIFILLGVSWCAYSIGEFGGERNCGWCRQRAEAQERVAKLDRANAKREDTKRLIKEAITEMQESV